MVVPPIPPDSQPMLTCPLTSIPRVSLPTPIPSDSQTKKPHVQKDRGSPCSPRVFPTLTPTLQYTDFPPRVTHLWSTNPIYHHTHPHAHIPPTDDDAVSHQTRPDQGLSNLAYDDLYPSAASLRIFSNYFITKQALPVYGPKSGKTMEHLQIFCHPQFK